MRQWPNDFNVENLAGVCGLFADNVVLAYPDPHHRDADRHDASGKVLDIAREAFPAN